MPMVVKRRTRIPGDVGIDPPTEEKRSDTADGDHLQRPTEGEEEQTVALQSDESHHREKGHQVRGRRAAGGGTGIDDPAEAVADVLAEKMPRELGSPYHHRCNPAHQPAESELSRQGENRHRWLSEEGNGHPRAEGRQQHRGQGQREEEGETDPHL